MQSLQSDVFGGTIDIWDTIANIIDSLMTSSEFNINISLSDIFDEYSGIFYSFTNDLYDLSQKYEPDDIEVSNYIKSNSEHLEDFSRKLNAFITTLFLI